MTNPDNIVRVRARNGGRASVYEANGWAQAYSAGLLEGNGVKQNTSANMNVLVGGSTTKPDVVLAENAAGYRVALDIVGQQVVAITKPSSNSRISAIVAYTDDLSLGTTQDTVTGSPSTCGLIVVNGTAASTPSAPTDTQIRNAITSDGATGSQAAYCVIATILVASNTTAITDTLITTNVAKLAGTGVVTSQNIDFTTLRTELYKTSSNTLAASIPLNDNVENYDAIEIYFRQDSHDGINSVRITSDYYDQINLTLNVKIANTVFGSFTACCTASGKTISFANGQAINFNSNTVAGFGNTNNIVIRSVIGLKFS